VISRYVYLKSSVYFPRLYGWSYSLTNLNEPDQRFEKWLHTFGVQKIKEIVNRENPNAVIHTFPFLAMAQLRRKTGIRTSIFTVLTDYVLHNRWIHPETDRYFVATDQLKETMIAKGVRKERISVTGIPLRGAFRKAIDNEAVARTYGLEPGKKYILVMAGAYGVLSNVNKMIEALLEGNEYQILLICGRNQKLLTEMQALYADNGSVNVFGFVEKMEQMMSLSSCMITKAGGITLTEAMALRIPVIVYRPLPGQEKGNAEYLADQGFVQIVNDVVELKRAMTVISDHEQRVENATEPLFSNNAANLVVDEVLAYLESEMTINQAAESRLHGRQILHDYI
jgi:processive 1,2-diacylglycerol beta-glucosyltransferase